MSATQVRIDGDFIVLEVTLYDGPQATHFTFDVPISDVQTTISVDKWKRRLAEKKWAEPSTIEAFENLVLTYWRNR